MQNFTVIAQIRKFCESHDSREKFKALVTFTCVSNYVTLHTAKFDIDR